MAERKHRVVVWSTGGIGSIAIRAIHERPRPRPRRGLGPLPREGRHGCGRARQRRPDRVGCHQRCRRSDRAEARLRDLRGERPRARRPGDPRLRQAPRAPGINVVTTSTTRLINPHAYEPAEWRDQLAAAAKAGQVSLYASGIEPGFAADYLPLVLTHAVVADREDPLLRDRPVRRLRRPDIMIDAMGFGQPLDFEPWIAMPGRDRRRVARADRMVAEASASRSTRCGRRSTAR